MQRRARCVRPWVAPLAAGVVAAALAAPAMAAPYTLDELLLMPLERLLQLQIEPRNAAQPAAHVAGRVGSP